MAKKVKLAENPALVALREQIESQKLTAQLAQVTEDSAAQIRSIQTVRLAKQALDTVTDSLARNKLPAVDDLEIARLFAKEAGQPMAGALSAMEELVQRQAQAEAGSTIARLASKAKIPLESVPTGIRGSIEREILNKMQPLPGRTQVRLLQTLRDVADYDRKVAAESGTALLKGTTKTAEQISFSVRSAADTAAEQIIKGAPSRVSSGILNSAINAANSDLSGISKAARSSRNLKLGGIGGAAAGLGGMLLFQLLSGSQPEEQKGGMPSMQELMVLKAMTDIQTQNSLAESLIGLRQAQGQKAQTTSYLDGLKAQGLLQSLTGGAATGVPQVF